MAASSSSGGMRQSTSSRQIRRSGTGGGGGGGGSRPDPITEATTLIDARFHRAVDIIQSLPKSGPISTTYEEKLMLYSLYKQATEGPVRSSRPGLLDLLGRAKWDAWKKREKLTKVQAQEAYVETLFSILKGFSDRTQAVELMKELREYGKPAETSSRGRDAEYASTSSSIRSLSPPPETSGSRRSYHSALHTAGSDSGPIENDETPRRRNFAPSQQPYPAQQQQDRSHQRNVGRREQDLVEEGEDEEYTSEDEESGSETASGDDDERYRRDAGPSRQQSRGHRQTYQQPLSQLQQTQVPPQRFSGPSPYQHPAQYPAPVQAQLSPHLPPIPQSGDLPRSQRPGPPSAVPSVSTLPPYAQPPTFGQRLSRGTHLSMPPQAALEQISASTSALQPGPGNRSGPTQANLDRALDSIQTSLAALHERLNHIEHTNPVPSSTSGMLSSYIRSSPILQFLGAVFSRILVALRLRAPIPGQRSLSALLGRALVAALAGVRDLSRDAVAILFLAAAVASLRSTRGDWRAVIRAWARVLALASGVGLAREGGLLAGLAEPH